VAASARDDVWAYGWHGVLDAPQPQLQLAWFHFDGHDWTRIDDGTGITDRLPGPFWSFAPADGRPAELWAAAVGPVAWRLHLPADCPRVAKDANDRLSTVYDQSWCALLAGGQVIAYAGRSPSEAYIVVRGSDGSQLLRFDGRQLVSVAVTPLVYDRLWVGASSVWATGTDAQKQAWAVRYRL
jgi:hypothetical protein